MNDFGRLFDQIFHILGCPSDVFLAPVFEEVTCRGADCLGAGGDMGWKWVAGFVVRGKLGFDFGAADSRSGFVYCHARW